MATEHQDFVNEIFGGLGLDLEARESRNATGFLLDINGADANLLLTDNGEPLDALEHLLTQIYAGEMQPGERFSCDAEGFRQTRRAELQAMARFAANSVRKNGRPFTFGVLTASERRAIHLALSTEEDLETESVGDGKARRLQIRLK